MKMISGLWFPPILGKLLVIMEPELNGVSPKEIPPIIGIDILEEQVSFML